MLGSLGRLARSPLATFLTVLVIALALALPAALKVFVSNAQAATGNFASAVDVSVYLKTDVPLAKAQQLAQAARERADVASVTLIPADKGLEDFRTYSGFGDALEALEGEPAAARAARAPKPRTVRRRALESLRRYFAAWPEVDVVQVDARVGHAASTRCSSVLRACSSSPAVLLGLGVLAVIGNTIRLEIQGRRAEIEVTKLVGGSNAFVRRPFLYTGVLYGLGGALLAWGIVAVAVLVLGDRWQTLARLYGSRSSCRGWRCRHRGIAPGRRGGAGLARRLDLSRAPPAAHRAARLRARGGRSGGRGACATSCVNSCSRPTCAPGAASATRVCLPKEFSSTMTTLRPSITACITRQRPASEM